MDFSLIERYHSGIYDREQFRPSEALRSPYLMVAPLLAQRILLLILSRVSDEEIRVNIIPKPLKADQWDDDAAQTTPLGVTATPQELDEQLPRQLVEFVEAHLGLSSTLRSAKEQMDAAAKAAREAARKSANTKSHSGSSKSASPGSPRVQAGAETNEN